MLKICDDILPQTCLTYLAFRVTLREATDRLRLWRQFGTELSDVPGYLAEVPFLKEVPLPIQIDALANTWARHISPEVHVADLVDESVIYAVCETSGRIIEQDPHAVPRAIKGGPLDVIVAVDHFLASEVRSLHLNLSNEGDFLLISQFLDMAPDEARQLKGQFRMSLDRLDALFDLLGRWWVSPELPTRLEQLLSSDEQSEVAQLLANRIPAKSRTTR